MNPRKIGTALSIISVLLVGLGCGSANNATSNPANTPKGSTASAAATTATSGNCLAVNQSINFSAPSANMKMATSIALGSYYNIFAGNIPSLGSSPDPFLPNGGDNGPINLGGNAITNGTYQAISPNTGSGIHLNIVTNSGQSIVPTTTNTTVNVTGSLTLSPASQQLILSQYPQQSVICVNRIALSLAVGTSNRPIGKAYLFFNTATASGNNGYFESFY